MTAVETAPVPDVRQLLTQWLPYVRRLSLRIALQFDLEVDEVCGEFALTAMQEAHRYDRARAAFSTWLSVVVARNVKGAIAKRRKRSVRITRLTHRPAYLEGARPKCDLLTVLADPAAPEPVETAIEREHRRGLSDAVAGALATLPVHQREAVRRRFWTEGEPLKTSAERESLRDALDALRERLARPDDDA